MEELRDVARVRRLTETGAARAIRLAAGASLGELARDVGVDRSTVHKWETGSRRPRGEAAVRYLRALEELSR